MVLAVMQIISTLRCPFTCPVHFLPLLTGMPVLVSPCGSSLHATRLCFLGSLLLEASDGLARHLFVAAATLAFPHTRYGLLYPFDYPYFSPHCLNSPPFPPLNASACWNALVPSLRPFTTSSGRFLLACMLCFQFHLRMLAFVVWFCFPSVSLCTVFSPVCPIPSVVTVWRSFCLLCACVSLV